MCERFTVKATRSSLTMDVHCRVHGEDADDRWAAGGLAT